MLGGSAGASRSAAMTWVTAAALVALLAGLVASPGCGGGGGGGDNTGLSVITGTVVDAANTSTGIGGAYIYVPTHPPSGVAARQDSNYDDATSATDGSYTLEAVPSGERTIMVEAPTGSSYVGIRIDLDVPSGVTINLRITLAPSESADQVASVTVSPDPASVAVGGQLQFSATVLDGAGQPVALTPTWAVTGGIGAVDQNGLFTAGTTPGTGHVVAIVAGESGAASVAVAQSGAALDVVLSEESVTVGGTVTATATFTSSGTPQAGRSVSFAVADTSIATVSPASATTDAQGQATTTVTGVGRGSTTLTATQADSGAQGSATVVVGPPAPAGLTAPPGSGYVALSWQAPSDVTGIAGYNVYRSETSGSGYTKVNGALVEAATTTYDDGGATKGVTYYYVVRSQDSAGFESGNSNEASTRLATRVAWSRYLATNWDIYIASTEGTERDLVRITQDTGWDGEPNLSGDGRRVVFSSDRSGDTEIYVADTSGTELNVTRISDNSGGEDRRPRISADGETVVWHSYQGGTWVYCRAPADGGVAPEVLPTGSNIYGSFGYSQEPDAPAISADGRVVAFRTGAGSVHLISTDPAVPSGDCSSDAAGSVSLSADARVAACRSLGGIPYIWAFRADQHWGTAVQLTSTAQVDVLPCLGPTGLRVVWQSSRNGNWDIYAGSTLAMEQDVYQIASSSADDTAPCYGDNGNLIAFRSMRDGNGEIYVASDLGTESGLVRITNNTADDAEPTMSVY